MTEGCRKPLAVDTERLGPPKGTCKEDSLEMGNRRQHANRTVMEGWAVYLVWHRRNPLRGSFILPPRSRSGSLEERVP